MLPLRKRKPAPLAGGNRVPGNAFTDTKDCKEHIAAPQRFQGRATSGSWLHVSPTIARLVAVTSGPCRQQWHWSAS